MTFKKYDEGKLEYDMLPNEVLEGIIKVMMYGAYTKGYSKDNWKKCEDTTRYYNAARRHQEAHRAGEYYDPESGLPHVYHEACNVIFKAYLEEQKHKAKNSLKALTDNYLQGKSCYQGLVSSYPKPIIPQAQYEVRGINVKTNQAPV
jgi:hypothetical protein